MKKNINSSLKVLFIFPFIISQLVSWPVGCVGPSFRVEETTIADIHTAMEAGKLTAQELVQMYLHRIEWLMPFLWHYDIEVFQKNVLQIMELGDPPHLQLSKKIYSYILHNII